MRPLELQVLRMHVGQRQLFRAMVPSQVPDAIDHRHENGRQEMPVVIHLPPPALRTGQRQVHFLLLVRLTDIINAVMQIPAPVLPELQLQTVVAVQQFHQVIKLQTGAVLNILNGHG